MYGLLLVKDWSLDVFRNASSTYLKGAPKYVRRRKEWVQVQKYKNEPHPMPRGPLALLYVNRLIHEEAAQVLYGQNRFIAVKDTSFNYNSILSGFGKVNAGRIRKLEVGVPKVVKTGSLKETEFKRFLSFVCEDFSNLQSLVLTTTPKNNPDFQASRKFKRQCRGVLFTAAQITQWHPVLKKAMLSRTAKGEPRKKALHVIVGSDVRRSCFCRIARRLFARVGSGSMEGGRREATGLLRGELGLRRHESRD